MDKKSDKKSIVKAITRVMEKYSYKELYKYKFYSKKIIVNCNNKLNTRRTFMQ